MRQIKFRAYDKETERMSYDNWCIFNYMAGRIKDREDLDKYKCIMQYTGLKDKNGKEIYEADIIKQIQQNEKGEKGEVFMIVEWSNGLMQISDNEENNKYIEEDPSCFNQTPQFFGKDIGENNFGICGWSEFASCEIMGNIYENPELLQLNKDLGQK